MIPVYLEVGSRRSFAMTIGWPGWGRQAKTPEEALEVLAEYRDRYGLVAERAGVDLPTAGFEVTTEFSGNATTDFGAPGAIPEFDQAALDPANLAEQMSLLSAAWQSFEDVSGHAPESLRKGPRGGGRDTSKVIEHVDGAERAYLAKIGVRAGSRPPEELRNAALARLAELANAPEETKWPPAYFVRRSAWHVVDHLWEIEDRS